ncbi:MAG: SpoIIE family protein phosphatase [Candidatus Woesearchaeota archaeon]
MSGHGLDARQKIVPLISDIEKIHDVASNPYSTKKDISKLIAHLDMRLNYDSLIALSLVRIFQNGRLSYMNEGENTLLLRKKDGLYSVSEKSRGKIGLFKLAYDVDIILDKLVPYDDTLSSGDRIFICTDGVKGPFLDEYHSFVMKEMIFKEIRTTPSLEQAILNINNANYQYSLANNNSPLIDDYTIVALELK